jgi:hypothetical protein
MTEQEWLTASRATRMLFHLRGNASRRKVLLFNCACCYKVQQSLDSDDREAVLLAEASAESPESIAAFSQRYDAERRAVLALGNFLNESVSEELAHALTTQTTLRLRLDGGQGHGIGSLAFATEKLADNMVQQQIALVRDIFGNPFRPVTLSPAWSTSTVISLARTIYDARQLPSGLFDNQRLGVLADALEDAGCNNADILGHLRGSGEHVRGCWVVDLVLGRK